jgi:tRNA A-37 threonylcarbamoyl transferase component Bud32
MRISYWTKYGGKALSEPERPATNLAGTVLEGAYRLVRLMGEGGMGAVYEAIQLRLNKRVAVKLMARELAQNQEALARFHREAEITSQLGHPHLVNVIDFGTAETGEPYLVMEYLEGEDLEHRLLAEGCLSIEAAVHITKQVASALGAAHARDIVHRDLKPANIFLVQVPGEPDFVKVLDFGISKVKAARAKLTRATAVIGTPNYMSPEQAAGRVEETDHRADQWALACIVWEMLAGRTPFIADDVSPLFYQITTLDPPSLSKLVPELPAEVDGVLKRALAKTPADRFASMREFSRAFEEAGLGRPADLTPTPVNGSDPWAVRTGNGRRVRLSASGRVPGQGGILGGEGGQRRGGNKVTTFSHTTGEMTNPGFRRRVRPWYAIAIIAAVVLMAGAVILLRTGSPPPRPAPTLPAPAAVVPLPEPPPSPPTVEPLPPPPPTQVSKAKGTTVDKKPPAEVNTRRKATKARPKRRIFQSL